ncbi:hypothetical protein OAU50_07965 [Planctomycetota bacterium]|nr:hypothetical protein [Planctomycetota bacterium]
MSRVSKRERDELVTVCEQIGALIFGQQQARIAPAVELLQKQAAGQLLKQQLDEWLPMFDKHYRKLEKVFGKGVKLDDANLVNDIKTKVTAAGYGSIREFITKVVMPVVSYHGLLKFLFNDAKVSLSQELKDIVVPRMNIINKVLNGASVALVLEDMGL